MNIKNILFLTALVWNSFSFCMEGDTASKGNPDHAPKLSAASRTVSTRTLNMFCANVKILSLPRLACQIANNKIKTIPLLAEINEKTKSGAYKMTDLMYSGLLSTAADCGKNGIFKLLIKNKQERVISKDLILNVLYANNTVAVTLLAQHGVDTNTILSVAQEIVNNAPEESTRENINAMVAHINSLAPNTLPNEPKQEAGKNGKEEEEEEENKEEKNDNNNDNNNDVISTQLIAAIKGGNHSNVNTLITQVSFSETKLLDAILDVVTDQNFNNEEILKSLANNNFFLTIQNPVGCALSGKNKTTTRFLLERGFPVKPSHFQQIAGSYKDDEKREMNELFIKHLDHNKRASFLKSTLKHNCKITMQQLVAHNIIPKEDALSEARLQRNALSPQSDQEKLEEMIDLIEKIPSPNQPPLHNPQQPVTACQQPPSSNKLFILLATGGIAGTAGIIKIVIPYFNILKATRIIARSDSWMNFRQGEDISAISMNELTKSIGQLVEKRYYKLNYDAFLADTNNEIKKLKAYLSQAQSRWKRFLFRISNDSIIKAQQGIERLAFLQDAVRKVSRPVR